MASLHQIQRTMTKQQQEIDALIAQQRQDRARLLEQNRKELEAIRKQYEQALKKHDQQTDAAYRKALDDMQFRLTGVYRQQLEALRKFDEAARREREKQLQELERQVEVLHQEVETIKQRAQRREENSRAEAERMLQDAQMTEQQTEKVPHDFFYPGELTIISASLDAARDMETNGMYDASTATALGAVTQMRLLQAKTIQAEDGWHAVWAPYSQWLAMMEDEMKALEHDAIETVSGLWTMDPDSLDDFSFTVFPTFHDAPDSVGYSFFMEGERVTIITDTGKTSDQMKALAEKSDVLFLESNYCPDMLKHGPYPVWLQKRILSEYGHLSNFDALEFVKSLGCEKCRKVYLCHISDKNNTPEKVQEVFDSAPLKNIKYIICKRGIPVMGEE